MRRVWRESIEVIPENHRTKTFDRERRGPRPPKLHSAGDAIAGAGYQKYRLLSQSIAALGNLGLNIILIPKLGWLGAAWTSLGTDALLGVMNWVALFHLAARAKHRLALAL